MWLKILSVIVFVIAFSGCIHTTELHTKKQNIIFVVCLFVAFTSMAMITNIL